MRAARLFRVVALAAAPLFMVSFARATSVYDSGGFETPRFTTTFVNPFDPTIVGNIRGQDAGTSIWRESTTNPNDGQGAVTGIAAVENKAGGIGADLQDVVVTRTQYDNRFSPTLTYTQNLPNPVCNIDWSMKVTQTTTDLGKFGPFFGIEAYDASGGPALRIGGFGLDATTGEVLFEDPTFGGFNIGTPDVFVPFDEYHDYNISLNYATHTYSGYVDGQPVMLDIPFYTAGVIGLTDADISALQAAPTGQDNPTGTAYFNNYKVYSAPLPEPASLGLLVLAAGSLIRRRAR